MRHVWCIDEFVDLPAIKQTAPETEHSAGVSLDITDLVNPLLSITPGAASTLHVGDPSRHKRNGSDILVDAF